MKPSFRRLLTVGGIAVGASALTLLAVRARAAGIPEADGMTYTGYLEDGEGQPLAGEHSIAVQFWESAEATDDLCTGSLDSAELQSGRFQVPLPVSCSDAVKESPDVWVSVSVDGASLGRTKLGTVPYALEAGRATTAATAGSLQSSAVRIASGDDVCTYTTGKTDCVCASGEVAIGGGACAGQHCASPGALLAESASVSESTWRLSCENTSGTRVACYGAHVVCLKVSP
jgi:hypothetical protein